MKKIFTQRKNIEFLISELDVLAKMQYEYFINGQRKYIVNLIKYGKVLHSKKLNVCSFGAPDILKVDTDGNIFKCHRMIGNDEFLVGNIENNIQGNCVHHKYMNDPSEEWCTKTKISLEEALKLYARIVVKNPDLVEKIFRR